ncbi:MAG: hypothetical protein QNJ98_07580 [Planctomycetota bacterium]|nr:hypothetical protein [Planctomycetota bacterium]
MVDTLEPTDAFRDRVMDGRAIAERGDFQQAETHFRRLLDEARSAHLGNTVLAVQSLVTLYGRGGRYLEAYMLSRWLATQARTVGVEADIVLAFALGAECGSLSQLDLDEPLGDVLEALRAVLNRAPEQLTNLELEYHAAAGVWARNVGDLERARRHATAYRRIIERHDGLERVFRWALFMGEAQLAYAEGNYPYARHLVTEFGRGLETPPFHRLKELALAVQVHAALGEAEAARPLAEEAFALLESVQTEEGLASGRIHEGSVLARELERLGEWALAARTHDLVAAAILIRMRQLEACAQELPELGLEDAGSSAVLAAFRKQFVREQRALLRRVAALLDAHGSALLDRSAAEGLVTICAWCESVRPEDGRWLPVGHFVPREGSVAVTHAMCPACAEAAG